MSFHQLLKGHNLKLAVTARMHTVYLFALCTGSGFQYVLKAASGKCKADVAVDSNAWRGVLKLYIKYVRMNLCTLKRS